MAAVAFVGFEFDNETAASLGGHGANITAAAGWGRWVKPRYVYHNAGVAGLNPVTGPPGGPTGSGAGSVFRALSGGAGIEYCLAGGSGGTSTGAYTGATSVTRATWATAQGAQLAIVRNRVVPALANDEYWFSFEIRFENLGTSSLASSYQPSAAWGAIWRWGDLRLVCKQTTFISGSGSTTTHDVVFALLNNGSEVATVTVPNVVVGSTRASNTVLWCLVRARLHATLGSFNVSISGVSQSAPYTDQNTVSVTAEAAATEIYFGPPVLDNGTNAYSGAIDNFLVDDAAFPAGRPFVRIVTLASDETLTNALAAGTSPTTVTDALSNYNDAKHLRFSAVPGSALLNNTMPTTTGFGSDVLGFAFMAMRCANRYPIAPRYLEVGVNLSGVDSMDGLIQVQVLPFSSIITPPETSGITLVGHVFEKPGGGKYTISELPNIRTVIKANP